MDWIGDPPYGNVHKDLRALILLTSHTKLAELMLNVHVYCDYHRIVVSSLHSKGYDMLLILTILETTQMLLLFAVK